MNEVVPRLLRVEASSFCQLRCPSCPTTKGEIPAVGSGFLRFADFRQLIDLNPSVTRIELSNNGEIFLNPELVSILEYAAEKRVAITVANGANLNNARDEMLEALVRCRVELIACSIDGASQATYATYRVRGDFAAVIANIERINHYKEAYRSQLPRLAWQFVVFGHNEHEIPLARAMAARLGMEFYSKLNWDASFSPVRDAEFVRAQTRQSAITREEYARRHGREYLGQICEQLWEDPQINWDGKLLGCCQNVWGDFGGNAFRDGLVACLASEKLAYARDMLCGRQPPRDDIPCTTCRFYRARRARGDWVVREES